MRVAVLGRDGLLGHVLVERLRQDTSLSVIPVGRSVLDAERPDFTKLPPCDFAINAIGILRAGIDEAKPESVARAIRVNALFPHELALWARGRGVRVIHFSTDAVFANERRECFEDTPKDGCDAYSQSKALGEPRAETTLVLRGSIVGPDPVRKRGLLEFFLAQKDGATLEAFTNQLWQGVTTAEFAELCRRIVVEGRFDALRGESWVHHLAARPGLSKFDLLATFKKVYAKEVTLVPREGKPVSRFLGTRFRGMEGILARDVSLEAALRAQRG